MNFVDFCYSSAGGVEAGVLAVLGAELVGAGEVRGDGLDGWAFIMAAGGAGKFSAGYSPAT